MEKRLQWSGGLTAASVFNRHSQSSSNNFIRYEINLIISTLILMGELWQNTPAPCSPSCCRGWRPCTLARQCRRRPPWGSWGPSRRTSGRSPTGGCWEGSSPRSSQALPWPAPAAAGDPHRWGWQRPRLRRQGFFFTNGCAKLEHNWPDLLDTATQLCARLLKSAGRGSTRF